MPALCLSAGIFLSACEQSNEPKVPRLAYQCASGKMVHASYPTNQTAVVGYEGQVYKMTLTEAASGARYLENEKKEVVWWTKGSNAGAQALLIYLTGADKKTEQIIESCVEMPASD